MPSHVEALIVFTTVPDEALAVKIAETLVESRLAACVHMLPAGRSVYRWQGKIETAEELTLVIKTSSDRRAELEAALKGLHPYELPEILSVPAGGLPAYLEWIDHETRAA